MSSLVKRPGPSFFRLLVLFAIAVPAWAEVYTWKDDAGQQQYSDRPPETQDYRQWEPPENPNSDLQLPEPRERRPVVTDKGNERERSARANSGPTRQEKRCRRYEAELERINSQLRAGYREPKGNRLRAKRRRLQSKQFRQCM